jgi:hypothetical protein
MSEDMIAKQAAKITRLYNKNKELRKDIKSIKEKNRVLKVIMDYFIAQFNDGTLQVIDQHGWPDGVTFGEYCYDFTMKDGKIELLEKKPE